jgi:DNA adenine methylase
VAAAGSLVAGDAAPAFSPRRLPVRPFIRWAGGKRWLRRYLPQGMPSKFGRYFEPFLGSGAVFFALAPEQAFLTDLNPEIITAFEVVRDDPEGLVEELRLYRNTPSDFYRIRSWAPETPLQRAARFIYFNRTSWNGLFRLNSAGQFNVPYGDYPDRAVADVPRLRAASRALQGVRLAAMDFADALGRTRAGDLVFVDPPYAGPLRRAGFTSYTRDLFDWKNQVRLARALRDRDARGVHFLLTNRDHPMIRSLYRGFRMRLLRRTSIISSDAATRGPVVELVVANFSTEIGEPIAS